MTQDTLLPFDLPAVKRKKVTADFGGGLISSDGGLVLLRGAERRLGLAEALAGCIREWRDPALVVHTLPAMLRFRMFAIACGYEDEAQTARLAVALAMQTAARSIDNELSTEPVVFGPDTEPPLLPAPTTLDEVRPIDLRPVVRETREGRLWNEFVARYHYLGYKTLVGAQMRYAVHDRNGWPIAMLGFSTAAWKLAPRDNFIGWTPRSREKNLPLVVDNPRFLILPWITIPNLGSHILALIRRRLPLDWAERYSTTPMVIETFVETPRYTGAVYKASGWIHVGTTQGRGRYDRDKLYDKPRKDIWLRPLRKIVSRSVV